MNYDLTNAEAYARSAPGFLKSARERGDASAAAEQERRIAWANGVLAKHGKPPIPGAVAPPTPSVASATAPVLNRPEPPSPAAKVPSPAASPPTANHGWDGIVADLNRSAGFAGQADPVSVSPTANHGWDAVMATVSAEAAPRNDGASASSDPWAEAMATVNAEGGAGRRED